MTQDLFPAALAERLKSRVTERYRPSNGTEGEMFQERWCHDCTKDRSDNDSEKSCEILLKSFCFDIDDPQYPNEWQYGADGQPKCTAFERIGTVKREPDAPGQGLLF